MKMYQDDEIYMGLADGQRVTMQLNMSNRHGLIAGASGMPVLIILNMKHVHRVKNNLQVGGIDLVQNPSGAFRTLSCRGMRRFRSGEQGCEPAERHQ